VPNDRGYTTAERADYPVQLCHECGAQLRQEWLPVKTMGDDQEPRWLPGLTACPDFRKHPGFADFGDLLS
jgi:hypothetical protein